MDHAITVHKAKVEKALDDLAWGGMRRLQLRRISRGWHTNCIHWMEGVEVACEEHWVIAIGPQDVEHGVGLLRT
jgi:hypothetical protein